MSSPKTGRYLRSELLDQGRRLPRAAGLFEDGHKMPRSWAEWLKMAEEMERGLKAYGHPVMRVHIDPRRLRTGARPTQVRAGSPQGVRRGGRVERYGDQR